MSKMLLSSFVGKTIIQDCH